MTSSALLSVPLRVTGEIDPNTVRPGWVALLIVLALGVATFLLWRNMGKQLKKIDFDSGAADDPAPAAGGPDADGAAPATAERPDDTRQAASTP